MQPTTKTAKQSAPAARAQRPAARRPAPGFAVEIQDSTDLGLAMLIAESEDGHYEPIAVIANVGEAREIASSDMASRRKRLDRGEDPGICPYDYKIWARGIDGDYRIACVLDLTKIDS